MLTKLGYQDSIENLDDLTADAFAIIESEINKLQDQDLKKMRAKRGK